MGVAVYDPRRCSSNSEVEQIQAIQVQHTIIDEWAWVTSKTCPNRYKAWHRGAHKPSPYTATFCLSDVQSSQKDANAESKLFYDLGYYSCDNDVEHWDFQLWLPV
ncbi:hypothetical protein B0H65DRAFT_445152 [Neurospora tetraspora]|uniref:Uncharacterized protein n=1 Tax=Neurospora tetraspora TaxID=94610 RepID=A0AAE0J939_9PEZI|nr:hypothetical protein B0H65DRAFT_445152 [Neurospora tetraspora]